MFFQHKKQFHKAKIQFAPTFYLCIKNSIMGTIRVNFERMSEELGIFVKVVFMDVEGNVLGGVMLIDTGSCQNFLFVRDINGNRLIVNKEDGADTNSAVSDGTSLSDAIPFYFEMGKHQFQEPFYRAYSSKGFPETIGEYPFIGIIGNAFLQKHHLAVDYSDNTLHTSKIKIENYSDSDYDVFFLIKKGIKIFSLPVLQIKYRGKGYAALVSSGSASNLITSLEVKDEDVFIIPTDVESSAETKVNEVEEACLQFIVPTRTGSTHKDVSYKELFKLAPQGQIGIEKGNVYMKGENNLSFSILLGSNFMDAEGWVVDFGAMVIYRLKSRKIMEIDPRVHIKNRPLGNIAYGKQEKRIKFYTDAHLCHNPYIVVYEGTFEGMVFLIDSGASNNEIFNFTYQHIKNHLKPTGETEKSFGIEGKYSLQPKVTGSVTFCGEEYEMTFSVSEDNEAAMKLRKNVGFTVSGIIGCRFMLEHGWVINFRTQEIELPKFGMNVDSFRRIMNKNYRG